MVEKYDLVNTAIEKVYSVLAPVIGNAYRMKIPYTVPLPGRYLTVAGAATFTVATSQITSSSLNIPFQANDLERPCMFRIGASIYWTYIDSVVSTTVITVRGNSLPPANSSIDELMIPTTTPLTTSMMLAQLRIDRSGEQTRLAVESSETQYIEPLSLEEFKTWRASALNNQQKIVYCLSGDEILLQLGSGLTTYGTLTLYAQRLPRRIQFGGDFVDIPDGAAVHIGITSLKILIARRQGKNDFVTAYTEELRFWVDQLNKAFIQVGQVETIVEKIKALV